MSAGAAAASASDAKAGRKEQPLMTLLKSFGTVVAPIMMSEIVNHASAEKCDNLLTAEEPDEDALHKGATLVLMVLFWFKYVPLNFLGVTPNPSAGHRAPEKTMMGHFFSETATCYLTKLQEGESIISNLISL